MEQSTEVAEDEVVSLLNPVSKAMRIAQLKLLEAGFEVSICIYTYVYIFIYMHVFTYTYTYVNMYFNIYIRA
jgi:hypothetical protein